MSRPNQALALGRTRASLSTAADGSTLVNNDGHAAISRNAMMRAIETQKIGFFLRDRQASDESERASSCPGAAVPVSAPTAMVDASVMADPRVEHAVQEVDEQVDEQEHQHQHRHRAHDGDAVAVVDAGEQVTAD